MKNEEGRVKNPRVSTKSILFFFLSSSLLTALDSSLFTLHSSLHWILHSSLFTALDSSLFTLNSSLKMTIGIYGGSFNPIHNGHIALARSFLTKAALDEVWFIVSPQNPFKVNDTLLDDRKRFLMVEEALKDEPGLVASDYEFGLPRPSYMWNTLQSLSRSYPQHTFTLLIGGDNWAAFDRWYHADDILRTYRIAVYPRRGDTIRQADLPDNVMLLDTELIDISSTEIRQRIAEGLPIDSLVPERIEEKIRREYLVREEGRTKREE